ncbi:hypothetical protein M5K25_009454 [Dendrobium thyrsiflorum]|uniref:Uncharacterized protein n=1 Tax=Dendrobium thyrsiflorum TaxID=117978 RepID=A0ABD0V6J6_DENTH
MEEQMRLCIRLAMEDSGFHLHTSMDNKKFYPKEPNVQAQAHARKKPRKAGNFYGANRTYYTGGYDPVVPPVAPPPDRIGTTDALIRLSVLLRQSFVLKISTFALHKYLAKEKEKTSSESRNVSKPEQATGARAGMKEAKMARRLRSFPRMCEVGGDRRGRHRGFGLLELGFRSRMGDRVLACEQEVEKRKFGLFVGIDTRRDGGGLEFRLYALFECSPQKIKGRSVLLGVGELPLTARETVLLPPSKHRNGIPCSNLH